MGAPRNDGERPHEHKLAGYRITRFFIGRGNRRPRPIRLPEQTGAHRRQLGGGQANDASLRIIGDKLSHIWGQQVVMLNQPGAGGGISAKVASQAPNDGYTLYMPATSPFLALPGAPGVAPNLPIELPRDFAAICFVLEQPLFIGASHKSGINTIADVIRMAKEKPGRVSYAATGRGRLTHLTMELLQARTGIKLQLIPYAGGTGAGDERRDERPRPARARRLCRARAGDQGQSDQRACRHGAEAAAGIREPADRSPKPFRISWSAPGT